MSDNGKAWREAAQALARFTIVVQDISANMALNTALMRLSWATQRPMEELLPVFKEEYELSGTTLSLSEYVDRAFWEMSATGKLPEEIAQHFRYLTDDGRKYLEEGDEQC